MSGLAGGPHGEGAERPPVGSGAPLPFQDDSVSAGDLFAALLEQGPSASEVVDGAAAEDLARRMTKSMRKRRSVPIMGYTGTSGHGKSASMVRDTLASLHMGRRILSTVEILDAHTGNPHPLYTPFERFSQLDDFRDGDLLMDEITGIMDSHEAAMPKRVRRILPQMRRRNVLVRWSGIDWDNSNRRLRQMTQAVTASRGYFPDRSVMRVDSGTFDAIPLWAPNRIFHLITRDAQMMNKSEDSAQLSGATQNRKTQTKKPKILAWELWKGPGSDAFRSYNTLGDVLAVDNGCDHVLDDGTTCGLKVMEKTCKGHDGEPVRSARRRVPDFA